MESSEKIGLLAGPIVFLTLPNLSFEMLSHKGDSVNAVPSLLPLALFLTEVMGNTVLVALVAPMIAGVASGHVTFPQMARAEILLNFLASLLLTPEFQFIMPLLF